MQEIAPKDALNRLSPLPCCFIISVSKNGKPSGMIASWVMQTSFEPPLLTVSVGKSRHTFNLIKSSKEFVVAAPNKKMEKALMIFGSKSGRDTDKFKEAKLKTAKAKLIKSPILIDATLNYECKLVKSLETGDHVIFVGKVVAAHINAGKKVLMSMGRVNGKRVFQEF